ncbi:hypothetical protein [Gramella sp. KN1008]|uniref:hypothetical protein n=1 Tax=Gramella sp. KN1008 TaxID=2529298 RepID=UPI001038CC73|nr:hypothetical protein [Gramella sp. KN1008]TBW29287.1 hypothetical protein EZJ28_05225 [Gramella sp. KN1008]
MKINHLLYFLLFIVLIPFSGFGQKWESAIDHINKNRAKMSNINYRYGVDEEWQYVDSILVINNSNFEKAAFEIYQTATEPDVEVYYVIAMDFPLTELMDVSANGQQIQLSFSRNCQNNNNKEIKFLEFYIPSEREKYVTHAALKHLKATTALYHKKKHDAEVCTLGIEE